MFLRGMYDSEGSVDYTAKTIHLYNQNKKLLQLCKSLLLDLGIECNSLRVCIKKGKRVTFPNNKKYTTKRNMYELIIGKRENLIKFRDIIGFNIKRKQNKLIKSINSYKEKRVIKI